MVPTRWNKSKNIDSQTCILLEMCIETPDVYGMRKKVTPKHKYMHGEACTETQVKSKCWLQVHNSARIQASPFPSQKQIYTHPYLPTVTVLNFGASVTNIIIHKAQSLAQSQSLFLLNQIIKQFKNTWMCIQLHDGKNLNTTLLHPFFMSCISTWSF